MIWPYRLHPDIATSLNNLAVLYDDQSRYTEAESLFQRADLIDERNLGPDHPGLATDLENYAVLLRATGHIDRAEELEAPADSIRLLSACPR